MAGFRSIPPGVHRLLDRLLGTPASAATRSPPDSLKEFIMRSQILAMAAVAALFSASQAFAQRGQTTQCRNSEYGNPDLFANYYL